ncbi:MAG: fused MFS/spermidine synthase [Oligoflexia bacterium]|nr:fused MFS/spermidine synthase [Oligoflexia bacterium]
MILRLPHAFFVVFYLNFSVFAFEMLLPRIIAPFWGSSYWIWAATIILVMLGMSIGYFIGGKKRLLLSFEKNSMYYFAFLGILSFLFPTISSWSIQHSSQFLFSGAIINGIFILIPFIILVIISAATMVCFSPFIYQRFIKNISHLFLLGTTGSLVGIIVQTFIFIPLFGTIKSFCFIGFIWILFAIAEILLKKKIIPAIITLLILSAFCFVNISDNRLKLPTFFESEKQLSPFGNIEHRLLYSTESPYQWIRIYENTKQNIIELTLNESFVIHSNYYNINPFEIRLNDYLFVGAGLTFLNSVPSDGQILILGASGGTMIQIINHYFPNMKIDAVEIDGLIYKVAQKYLHLDREMKNPNINFIVEDARMFLNKKNLNKNSLSKKYDLILMDAYSGGIIPPHLATTEFFSLLRQNLKEGGLFGMNVPVFTLNDPLLSAIINTTSNHFKHLFITNYDISRLLILSNNPTLGELKTFSNSQTEHLAAHDTYKLLFEEKIEKINLTNYNNSNNNKSEFQAGFTDDLAAVEWIAFKSYSNLLR